MRELENSHVIPRNVVKKVQSLFPNSDLWWGLGASSPKQDVLKYRLLCRECEVLLSVNEGMFSRHIFQPFVDRDLRVRDPFEYREWLLPFVVGLAWRTLARDVETYANQGRPVPKFVEDAGKQWGAYIRGETTNPGPSEHHLLFATLLINVSTGQSPGTLSVEFSSTLGLSVRAGSETMRIIASNLLIEKERAWIFVNLGGVILVSSIRPTHLPDLLGTRISPDGGELRPDAQVVSVEFRSWFEGHVEYALDKVGGQISPHHQEMGRRKALKVIQAAIDAGTSEGVAFLKGAHAGEELLRLQRETEESESSPDDPSENS
jgi:hypothetical protein